MIVEISAYTNEGRVRTNNEDSWDIIAASWKAQNKTITISGTGVLLVVADGMGGTNAGEVASRIAVETFRKEFEVKSSVENDENSRLNFLENLIKKAHQNIISESTRNLDHVGMGTTAVLAWILDDKVYVAWCGDSRLYLYRIGKPFSPFTDDHSLVWEQVVKGNMNSEQARLSDESNIILQSLGDIKQPPKPQSRVLSIQQNDRLILCSDGLNSMLSDGEIESLIAAPNIDTTMLCRQLVDAANIAGGRDNTTVIVANIIKGQKTALTPYPIGKKSGLSRMNMILLSVCLFLAAGLGYYYFNNPFSLGEVQIISIDERNLLEKLNDQINIYEQTRDSFAKQENVTAIKLSEFATKINDLTKSLEKFGIKDVPDSRISLSIDSLTDHRIVFNNSEYLVVSKKLTILTSQIREETAKYLTERKTLSPQETEKSGLETSNPKNLQAITREKNLEIAQSMIDQSNYLLYAKKFKDCQLLKQEKAEFDKIKPENIEKAALVKRHIIKFNKNNDVIKVSTTTKKLMQDANFISSLHSIIVKFDDKIKQCADASSSLTPIKN